MTPRAARPALVQTRCPAEGRDALYMPEEWLPKPAGRFPCRLRFRGWGDPGVAALPVWLLPSPLAPSSPQSWSVVRVVRQLSPLRTVTLLGEDPGAQFASFSTYYFSIYMLAYVMPIHT